MTTWNIPPQFCQHSHGWLWHIGWQNQIVPKPGTIANRNRKQTHNVCLYPEFTCCKQEYFHLVHFGPAVRSSLIPRILTRKQDENMSRKRHFTCLDQRRLSANLIFIYTLIIYLLYSILIYVCVSRDIPYELIGAEGIWNNSERKSTCVEPRREVNISLSGKHQEG